MGSADDRISVYLYTLGAIVCLGLPCSATFSWAVPSLGPIEQSALKSFLGASCVSEMVLVGLMPGHRNTLPNSRIAQGDEVPHSWWS